MDRYKKRAFHLALVMAVIMFFSGCFINETPKCSHDDVYDKMLDLYTLEQKKAIYPDADFPAIISLESFRTISHDDKVGRWECKAIVNFEKDISGEIEYAIQKSEDGNNFFVETENSFVDIFAASVMLKLNE